MSKARTSLISNLKILKIFSWVYLFSLLFACKDEEAPIETPNLLQLISVKVGTNPLMVGQQVGQVPSEKPVVTRFALEIKSETVEENFRLLNESGNEVALNYSYLDEGKTISAEPHAGLEPNKVYTLQLGAIEAVSGEVFPGATYTFKTLQNELMLESITVNGQDLRSAGRISNVPVNFQIMAAFSDELNESMADLSQVKVRGKSGEVPLSVEFKDAHTLMIVAESEADDLSRYAFEISPGFVAQDDRIFSGFREEFYTALDSIPKFPLIGTEELLTMVQRQTFRYFWDFAHPVSGLARERISSGDLVTIGGSGFGVMAILVAIERGFISRQQGVDRLEKIVHFLQQADRFHGVWPHWLHGSTGEVIPFSPQDDGGDLVETSFMIQGLLTARQYLNPANQQEAAIISTINQLWEEVEWDWYTKGGEDVLYWHWSPNFGWAMNHRITGYNEALITYILAAASPTHAIDPEVYHQGWAGNGAIANNQEYYGIRLPLGYDYGGPLFFAHYSFLGLDPRNLEDRYANYFTQNKNHSLINRAYVIDNPKNYIGYSEDSWGLTASDNPDGYAAHSPTNDLGVITPTAAISSIPYTPEYSLAAIEHFYYLLGDRLWGEYGFYDAFDLTRGWTANSYLAIDQGPIIIMIENYRSALLWELFMSGPEIQKALPELGFTSFNKP